MIKILTEKCKIHETPLPSVRMNGEEGVTVEFDDIDEVRWSANFRPYQAYRDTTMDCIYIKSFCINGKYERYILEDMDSVWIKQLTKTLKRKDSGADFMKKAHHFIFPFHDEIIEIIAWKMELTKIGCV